MEVPSVQVVPLTALDDITFNFIAEPSLVTVLVKPLPPPVLVAVLSATEPYTIFPASTETARLVALIVAVIGAVVAPLIICPNKRPPITNTIKAPPDHNAKTKNLFHFFILNYLDKY